MGLNNLVATVSRGFEDEAVLDRTVLLRRSYDRWVRSSVAHDKEPGMKIAILLSLESFEGFYEQEFGLSLEEYLLCYRNDWSWEYIAGLTRHGIEVLLYIPSFRTGGIFTTPEGYRVRFLKIRPWYKLWVRFSWLNRSPVGRYVGQIANGGALLGDLARSLSRDDVDLLYLQGYWTGRYDYFVRRTLVPVIAADHGTSSYRQLTWWKQLSLRSACRVTCQTLDELVEVRGYGANAVLLSNGVDTNFFRPALSEPEGSDRLDKTVLCVTRLKNQPKRITDLIHAMKFLGPRWSLQLVGDGPDRGMLEKLACDLRVEDRVQFTGFVRDREALRGLYRSCGVFALCSSSEAVSLSVLEAMSCGAPVVVTDIRAFDSVVKHRVNGIKVPVGRPEELADAIRNAHDLRRNLGKAARETVVEGFSDNVTYARLARIMRECNRARSSSQHPARQTS